MAEPVSYFLQVKSMLDMGKAVYDRIQTVRSFKKSNKQLGDRLYIAMEIVLKILDLADEGKLQFETSGILTTIGLAFKRLHSFIKQADKFTQKLADKTPWKKFYQANDIKGTFESLNNELSCFQADMDSALQVNAVEERTEISHMLKKLKDSQQNYISTTKDDFEAAKKELEENLKQIQQGM